MTSSRTLMPALRIALYFVLAVMAAVAAYLLWTASQIRQPPSGLSTDELASLNQALSAFDAEVEAAQSGQAEGLLQVRRTFAAFAEDVDVLLNQSLNNPLRQNADFDECLIFLADFVQGARPLMGGDPAVLRAALPEFSATMRDLHFGAEKLLKAGFYEQALGEQAQRLQLARLITWVAILVLIALLIIGGLLFILRQQTAAIRRNSKSNRQANQRLAATINASMDAVIVADMNGIILDFNGSAEKIFGYGKEEVLGLNLSEIIIPPALRSAHKAGLKRYRETEEPKLVGQGTVAISAIRKDGSDFPVELLLARGEANEGPIMISYIRDMTEAKAAEQALQDARDAAMAADQAKSRFLAVMSHEMRTPLTGMFGALDLISESKLTKKQSGYLDLAQSSGQTLLRHVNDVLDISRIDSGQLDLASEAISLPDLLAELEQTNAPLAEKGGNRILTLSEGLKNPHIAGDAHRLRQVMLNLMSNSFKFTEDGLITVSVVETEVLDGKSKYRFKVEDTGAGIPVDHQPHIFEEFYTQDQSYSRTKQGTGLGLSIVLRLVQLMGGTIDFSSEPGKGAKFWFDLVLSHSAAPAVTPRKKKVTSASFAGRRVLLVEDNDTSRLVVGSLLRNQGLEVQEAENGAEAVTLAHDQPLDLILMDISMPVMDGLEATAKIRGGDGPNKATPILALTAHAMPEEQASFLAAGMAECVTKPIDPKTLRQILGNYLDVEAKTGAPNRAIDDLEAMLGPELFHKSVQTFLDETAEAFAEMQRDLTQGNWSSLQAQAHKTLGAAGLMGAQDLQAALRQVEQRAKSGGGSDVADLMAQAEQEWKSIKSVLSKRIG